MNLTRGKDIKGAYYRWGVTGVRYHYTVGNQTSRERAKAKAMLLQTGKRSPAAVRQPASKKDGSTKRKVGGKTPRKPKDKTVSSKERANKKIANRIRVAKTVDYRRAATKLQ